MADTGWINLDPDRSDRIRYALGSENWSPAGLSGRGWIPDLAHPGQLKPLRPSQRIDVVLLGDGFLDQTEFEAEFTPWLERFLAVEVYDRFRGAFRIRALFARSAERASSKRESFYRVPIGTRGGDKDDVRSSDWYKSSGTNNSKFRQRLFEAVEEFEVNRALYPAGLNVGTEPVIHNQLRRLYSNLLVVMLVRTSKKKNASGNTRDVPDTRGAGSRVRVNVAFGADSLHEFGHAFAYLEDEYISKRKSRASRTNPTRPSLFTLSNLTFSDRLQDALWRHLSPWGIHHRQAAGSEPSPVVGWLWRGGEQDRGVWHSEYQCLMNGTHKNYAYRPDNQDPTGTNPEVGATLRWKNPPRYCLWCQEVVTTRILEKTGQLARRGDPKEINQRGREWYERWTTVWRPRYWSLFNVAQQIDAREALYANPALELDSFTEIAQADGTFLPLEGSELYKPFLADSSRTSTPPRAEDELELLMLNAGG